MACHRLCRGLTLWGMRFQVEVRAEDEDLLHELAREDHRSKREQAGFLLHLKIHEEADRRKLETTREAVA